MGRCTLLFMFHPHRAAAILLRANNTGRVLLLRRSERVHRSGEWNLPGGQPEPGETPLQTAIRETHEETGIVIDPREVRLIEVLFPAYYVYEVRSHGGQVDPQLNWESDSWVWVWPEEAVAAGISIPANIIPLL